LKEGLNRHEAKGNREKSSAETQRGKGAEENAEKDPLFGRDAPLSTKAIEATKSTEKEEQGNQRLR
jgi:hypothetical protein